MLLRREVQARQVERRDLRQRAARREHRLARSLVEQVVEHLERAVEAEVVRRAELAAHERQDLTVTANECEVRFRVAAVDGDRERFVHAGASVEKRGR